jgi:hypothetical protein
MCGLFFDSMGSYVKLCRISRCPGAAWSAMESHHLLCAASNFVMCAAYNGGFRAKGPKAPEKGSFPLDHFAECTPLFRAYIECLRANQNDNRACKEASKLYMVCRMEKFVSFCLQFKSFYNF